MEENVLDKNRLFKDYDNFCEWYVEKIFRDEDEAKNLMETVISRYHRITTILDFSEQLVNGKFIVICNDHDALLKNGSGIMNVMNSNVGSDYFHDKDSVEKLKNGKDAENYTILSAERVLLHLSKVYWSLYHMTMLKLYGHTIKEIIPLAKEFDIMNRDLGDNHVKKLGEVTNLGEEFVEHVNNVYDKSEEIDIKKR